MSIHQLRREAVFDPEAIEIMALAYQGVLDSLKLNGSSEPPVELVAKHVISAATHGMRDAAEMRDRVISSLRRLM